MLKIERMELRGRIGARIETHNRKLQRANELMASLEEQMRKHKVELADWAKKLTDCKSAKSLKVECIIKFEADCNQLQNQLKAVTEQLEALRTRMKEAKAAFHQLKKDTTNSLCLRVEKCLRGFVMWEVHMLKWLKLDSLKRRLMSMKTNGAAGHKQLVRLVNSFSS